MSEQIIFEPGDIAIVTKRIVYINAPDTYNTEEPFLFIDNFCVHCAILAEKKKPGSNFIDIEDLEHLNRWQGLKGEKLRIYSWPDNADELCENYTIEVYKAKTRMHKVFAGTVDKNKRQIRLELFPGNITSVYGEEPSYKSIYTEEATGLWRAR